jgi:hypothetical protein
MNVKCTASRLGNCIGVQEIESAAFMNERDLCVIAIVCGARSRNGNKIYVANNKLMTLFPSSFFFFPVAEILSRETLKFNKLLYFAWRTFYGRELFIFQIA